MSCLLCSHQGGVNRCLIARVFTPAASTCQTHPESKAAFGRVQQRRPSGDSMVTCYPCRMVKFWKTSQIAILKVGWAKYGALSNIFQKIPPPRGAAAPGGDAGGGARGIFQKNVRKLFIFSSSYFQNRHLASFSKFQHLAVYPDFDQILTKYWLFM